MPVFLGESSPILLERMAVELARCHDPWVRQWLILPGVGRTEWLLRRWACVAGVAAHSQVVSLRSLIEQAASAEREPFSREQLTFAIVRALPDMARHLPLSWDVDCSVVDARVLGWAQRMADAIDLGLLCDGPEKGRLSHSFLGQLVEHPVVMGALHGHLGLLPRDAFVLAVQRWIKAWQERGGVPRLWIQLDAGVPGTLLDCLALLIDEMPERVHLSLLCPSLDFWGDRRTRRGWDSDQDAGPVLTALGRQAQDLHHQAIDRFLSTGRGGEELTSPPLGDSLLDRMKDACRLARAPTTRSLMLDGDWSLTVHSCRSPLRELEVCRDRILQALSEDPSLLVDDILVLLADPTTLAPLATAGLAPLPVRLPGLSGHGASAVATALLRLLGTLGGRLGLADLQALMEDPLIQRRFDLTDEVPLLIRWLREAQFRWGLDVAQRAGSQDDGEQRWNLAFALRRLGLGAIVEGDRLGEVVDGVVPLLRATGLSTALLARFAEFAQALFEARRDFVGSDIEASGGVKRSLGEWCRWLADLVVRFLGEGESAVGEDLTQLLNEILPSMAALAPEEPKLQSDAVLRLLEGRLSALGSGSGSNLGGVTVAKLHDYAGTPARMVLVAGLGADGFPGHEERPAWHPLAEVRKLGDPDRREMDRHALLLALLGAEERLVLTYQGGSDEDGKSRPVSTPLGELLLAADAVAMRADGEKVSDHVVFVHGLNGFSPFACDARLSATARSHFDRDLAGAAVLVEPSPTQCTGLWSQVLEPIRPPAPLTLRDLLDVVEEPCRILLRRLGLVLPDATPPPPQEDMLRLDALQRWSLCNRLLSAQIAGEELTGLRVRAEAAGELPPGRYGDSAWQEVQEALPAIPERGLSPLADPVQLDIGGRSLNLVPPPGWYRTSDASVVYCSASTRDERRERAVRIVLLGLSVAESTTEVLTWFKGETKAKRLTVPDPPRAQRLLFDLCQLHELAQCLPLPFWPEAYQAMCGAEERGRRNESARRSPEQIRAEAWSVWAHGRGYAQAPAAERDSTASRACFRGLVDPFEWAPPVAAPWLPEAGQPLAWRLFRLLSAWEEALGGAS